MNSIVSALLAPIIGSFAAHAAVRRKAADGSQVQVHVSVPLAAPVSRTLPKRGPNRSGQV